MKALKDYLVYLTPAQQANTCGILGFLLELAVKDFYGLPLVISPQGKADLWRVPVDGRMRVAEVKENGGNFRSLGKGNSIIFYAVFIDIDKPLNKQFGYRVEMKDFRKIGYDLKHIRTEKKDGAEIKIALQTLYNYSKGDFHGAKAFKLSEAWEAAGAVPFSEIFK